MRKLSQINERLFNGGVGRSQRNETRIEDVPNTNIKELKEVDLGLPFYFADRDLEWDDETLHTKGEWDKITDFIKKSDWRLMVKDDVDTLEQMMLDRTIELKLIEMKDRGDTLCLNRKTGANITFTGSSPRGSYRSVCGDNHILSIMTLGVKPKALAVKIQLHEKSMSLHCMRLVKDKH